MNNCNIKDKSANITIKNKLCELRCIELYALYGDWGEKYYQLEEYTKIHNNFPNFNSELYKWYCKELNNKDKLNESQKILINKSYGLFKSIKSIKNPNSLRNILPQDQLEILKKFQK